MIDFADKNGDGEVNKKEFLKMMKYDWMNVFEWILFQL